MARIIISPKSQTISYLRRTHKRVGISVRLKNEKIFLVKKPEYVYTRSLKQEECRERFRRAQELMLEEFKDPKRVAYWKRQAEHSGKYKTAKGCCRAYFYSRVKIDDIQEQREREVAAAEAYSKAIERGETGAEERKTCRMLEYQPAVGGSKSADVMKEERLARGDDPYAEYLTLRQNAHSEAKGKVYIVIERDIDEVDSEELMQAKRVYVRNGQRDMAVDKRDLAYYAEKGTAKQYLEKQRRKHNNKYSINEGAEYMAHGVDRESYAGREMFATDVKPEHERKIRFTLDELQRFRYESYMKDCDLSVVIAGREVFINEEWIAKLRDSEYLRTLRGITKQDLRRLWRVRTGRE